jgi:hypothetical protein
MTMWVVFVRRLSGETWRLTDRIVLGDALAELDAVYQSLPPGENVLSWHIETWQRGLCTHGRMHRTSWQQIGDRRWFAIRLAKAIGVVCPEEWHGVHVSPSRAVYGWSEAAYRAYIHGKTRP